MTSSWRRRKGLEGNARLEVFGVTRGWDQKKEQQGANPGKMEMGDGTRRAIVRSNQYPVIIF